MLDFDILKQQWEEEDEFERLSLEFMELLFVAWVALRNSTNVSGEMIADYFALTEESLKYCWGEEARLEMTEWELVLIHPSGEKIIKSLVET
jgi:hypothetical protein